MSINFKNKFTLEERKEEANRVLTKYPDRIPIVCEKSSNCNSVPDIDKQKYLVPCDITIGQFMFVIRKRIQLKPEIALYIFINGTIPPTSELITRLYEQYKNSDGFLYIEYSGENTFG